MNNIESFEEKLNHTRKIITLHRFLEDNGYTPQMFLLELMDFYNLRNRDVADILHLSPSSITYITKGHRTLSIAKYREYISKLDKALKIDTMAFKEYLKC